MSTLEQGAADVSNSSPKPVPGSEYSLPSTKCQWSYRVKRSDGSFVTLSVQGETHAFEFKNKDGSLTKPASEFRPNIDWNDLKLKTVAIMEMRDSFYDIVGFDADEHWLGPWIWNLYDGKNRGERTYIEESEGKVFVREENLSIVKSINMRRHAPPMPKNLIDIIYADHRCDGHNNPLIRPYMTLNPFFIKAIDKEMSNARRVYMTGIKLSRVYNPEKSNDYYQKLIDKYCWKSVDELKMKIEMVYSMPCDEFFDDALFGIYKLHPKTREYFHSIKYRDYSFDSTVILNDVIALNELEAILDLHPSTIGKLHASTKDIEFVLMYGGSGHMPRYTDFITRYYKDWTYCRCYDWLMKEAEKRAIQNHVITPQDEDEFLSKIANFAQEVSALFDYDNEYADNYRGFDWNQEAIEKALAEKGEDIDSSKEESLTRNADITLEDIAVPNDYNWHLKTIDEMDRTHRWICHDSAYYVAEKMKELAKENSISDFSISRYSKYIKPEYQTVGTITDRGLHSHGFCIMKYNGNWYTVDCCSTNHSEIRGPFSSFDDAMREQTVRAIYSKKKIFTKCVDDVKPGAPIDEFADNAKC